MTPYILGTIALFVAIVFIVATVQNFLDKRRAERRAKEVACHSAVIARILEEQNRCLGSSLHGKLEGVGNLTLRVQVLAGLLESKRPEDLYVFKNTAPIMTLSWIMTARRELELIFRIADNALVDHLKRERDLIEHGPGPWKVVLDIIWSEKKPLLDSQQEALARRDALLKSMQVLQLQGLKDLPPLFYPKVFVAHA